ncbi:MAG: T9SS type A sorting domain-containing protein [Flavobacteriales bacterium]|nr:T9SS type A sorting domain-containing protein [Flavobacteriales bacterium]
MNRTTTLVASTALVLSGHLCAQPVLTSTNMQNSSVQAATVFGASVGADGANVTWDISSATTQIVADAVIGPTSSTPVAAQFPMSNWAMTTTIPGFVTYYTLWSVTTNSLELHGEGIGSGFNEEVYTDPHRMIEFPMMYNDVFMDQFTIQGLGTQTVTWAYTGYGTLVTALGTFANVVKMHNVENDRTIFWNASPLRPLADFDFEGDGTLWASGANSVTENDHGSEVSVYPNPAEDQLFLSGLLPGDRIELVDVLGKIILTERTDRTSGSIPLSDLNMGPGTYVVRVLRGDTAMAIPFIKIED